jgi:phage terminase large subunit GpA-like protein
VWPKKASKNNSGRINLFLVGVDSAKDAIYARLRITRPGAGFCHFPASREADWFAQLTAESVTTRYSKGFPVRQWVKKPGARNEALDARVYAYAALQSLNVVWARFRDVSPPSREAAPETPVATTPPLAPPASHPLLPTPKAAPPPARRPRGGCWLNSWR